MESYEIKDSGAVPDVITGVVPVVEIDEEKPTKISAEGGEK